MVGKTAVNSSRSSLDLLKKKRGKCRSQGSYRSWKTWKVKEFRNFIFQAWKVMEFNCRSLKVMEN